MGEVIAGALGRKLDDVAVFAREGVTERTRSVVDRFSHPRGDIVRRPHGTVRRHRRTHRNHAQTSSRAPYAHGSLHAARFLRDKQTGLFSMQDGSAWTRARNRLKCMPSIALRERPHD